MKRRYSSQNQALVGAEVALEAEKLSSAAKDKALEAKDNEIKVRAHAAAPVLQCRRHLVLGALLTTADMLCFVLLVTGLEDQVPREGGPADLRGGQKC
jgi:hypothetical protein